ncbi:MAG: UDP-N-acetylglucosamine--N-acetylmuramyl-(pentapeptide) pyrophosphoryl-undecaprenol N-acetylglucosamine transferase [Verrucomicrobiota bacterium]|jgi:UDP-N-acetylglucosamine--N-acetylmuramyl-(pentapeptide) pyrophosphoryl-undecaprenol N-acetylglucosamine transferase
MNNSAATSGPPQVAAIACGGTGGHLFPGLAVGRELLRRGCAVTLLVSCKEIDRQAAAAAGEMAVVRLPAVGLGRGNAPGFLWRFWQSFRLSSVYFKKRPPHLVLAMGGFTAAPPILAGKRLGARTFLHESNTVPGRANRWLARGVDGAFVYFAAAGEGLRARRIEVTGMPVREELLRLAPAAAARAALGLKADAPVLLVMGGSQGARKINELTAGILPQLLEAMPRLQFVHLTGPDDLEKVRAAYAARQCPAVVRAFLGEMALALAAADLAVSRAGASSLAEFAAVQLPALLIPYPRAAGNHQYHNALAFARSGAARALQQDALSPGLLTQEILALLGDAARRTAMRQALRAWHFPEAAAQIADRMLHWTAADQCGVRPSPGAALLKGPAAPGFGGRGGNPDVAAPGDGRTPAETPAATARAQSLPDSLVSDPNAPKLGVLNV